MDAKGEPWWLPLFRCECLPDLPAGLTLQLRFPKISESMGNHDSKIVDAGSVD
jgi:hypothetical protein